MVCRTWNTQVSSDLLWMSTLAGELELRPLPTFLKKIFHVLHTLWLSCAASHTSQRGLPSPQISPVLVACTKAKGVWAKRFCNVLLSSAMSLSLIADKALLKTQVIHCSRLFGGKSNAWSVGFRSASRTHSCDAKKSSAQEVDLHRCGCIRARIHHRLCQGCSTAFTWDLSLAHKCFRVADLRDSPVFFLCVQVSRLLAPVQ